MTLIGISYNNTDENMNYALAENIIKTLHIGLGSGQNADPGITE